MTTLPTDATSKDLAALVERLTELLAKANEAKPTNLVTADTNARPMGSTNAMIWRDYHHRRDQARIEIVAVLPALLEALAPPSAAPVGGLREAIGKGLDDAALCTLHSERITAIETCVRAALQQSRSTPGADDLVERVAQFLHDEGGFGESYSGRTWPAHPDDTGQREGGWVKLVPIDAQAMFRDVARRLVNGFRLAASPVPVDVPEGKTPYPYAVEAGLLADIAIMMSEFVENWPQPKKVSTALKLIAKTFRAALENNPVPVDAGGALGEAACDIVAELRTFAMNMRRDDSDARSDDLRFYYEAIEGYADRIDAALHAAPAPAVGEGFVVVPREATEAMIEAAIDTVLAADEPVIEAGLHQAVWSAMLSAASGEPVGEKGRG